MKIFYLQCSQPPVQMHKTIHRRSRNVRCMAVCVCLSSNRFGLQRKKNDRQIYGAQSVFAYHVWRQLCMCGHVCTDNIEREMWAHGLSIGKCWNLCVLLLALSVCTRSWVKPWFWGCLSAQNVAWAAQLNWKIITLLLCSYFLCPIISPTLWCSV